MLSFFTFLSITQDLSRIKKNPTRPFVDIGKQETQAKFQQKILNCKVVEACQSFQIFRQNIWFLKNNRALSKFLYGILHYLISTIKLQRNQSVKTNFKLTTQATLSLLVIPIFSECVNCLNESYNSKDSKGYEWKEHGGKSIHVWFQSDPLPTLKEMETLEETIKRDVILGR